MLLLIGAWVCLPLHAQNGQNGGDPAQPAGFGANEMVPADSAQAQKAEAVSSADPFGAPQLLLPDGYQIADWPAVLLKHPTENRWFFKFDPPAEIKQIKSPIAIARTVTGELPPPEPKNPFAVPMEIVPCHLLEILTLITRGDKTPQRFRVKAEITNYHQRNYVYPRRAEIITLLGPEKTQMRGQSVGILDRLGVSAGKQEIRETFEEPVDSQQLEQLKQSLLTMHRPEPVNPAHPAIIGTVGSSAASEQGGSSTGQITAEGPQAAVIDRLGRILYDSDRKIWQFVFEADGQSLAEPPLVLLPCRLLEQLEAHLMRAPAPLLFRVSGEPNEFRQGRYLMLRKAVIKPPGGNLMK